MILNPIKFKNGQPQKTQKLLLKCDKCGKQQQVRLDWLRGKTREKIFDEWVCVGCRSIYTKANVYEGPEIVTNLKRNLHGEIIASQKVDVKCSKCGHIKTVLYVAHKRNRIKNHENEYLCKKCFSTQQMLSRNRSIKQLGVSFIEKYGEEKAQKIKKKIAKTVEHRMKNPKLRLRLSLKMRGRISNQKGKTIDQMYGVEKANEIRRKLSEKTKGDKNPQYGNPPPQGSGNGWSGWYKGWHFRSIHELSFMVNYIEKNCLSWTSAEAKKYAIPYIHYDGTVKNYFGDFILSNNVLVEIKPEKLINSKLVELKKQGALKWCEQNGFSYKIFSTKDFKLLDKIEIKKLVEAGNLKWLPRYENKYKELWK